MTRILSFSYPVIFWFHPILFENLIFISIWDTDLRYLIWAGHRLLPILHLTEPHKWILIEILLFFQSSHKPNIFQKVILYRCIKFVSCFLKKKIKLKSVWITNYWMLKFKILLLFQRKRMKQSSSFERDSDSFTFMMR